MLNHRLVVQGKEVQNIPPAVVVDELFEPRQPAQIHAAEKSIKSRRDDTKAPTCVFPRREDSETATGQIRPSAV